MIKEKELDNVTTISGLVADQAALHGLLARVRDYGMVLISIQAVTTDDTDLKSDFLSV